MSKKNGLPSKGQLLYMLVVVAIAGIGFVYKFMKFAKTAIEGHLLGFAVVPLVVYILIATGYAFLLAWAVSSGHYRNVEAQKDRMIDYEINGDDPLPQPHPGFNGLGGVARVLNGTFAAVSVGTLVFLMWTMFQPSQNSVLLSDPVKVAAVMR